MALSIELGRYYIARTQIAAAADASALAAAIEINQNTFVQTGEIVPNSTTYSWAQKAANLNGEELISHKIYPSVSNIVVKNGSVMQQTQGKAFIQIERKNSKGGENGIN